MDPVRLEEAGGIRDEEERMILLVGLRLQFGWAPILAEAACLGLGSKGGAEVTLPLCTRRTFAVRDRGLPDHRQRCISSA